MKKYRVCDWMGKDQAIAQVHAAVRRGELPHAKTLRCVDCGRGATEYEHRYYNRPLEVEPVCRGCNLRRGPAVPLAGSVDRMLSRGAIPYRSAGATRRLFALLGCHDVAAQVVAKPTIEEWRRLWRMTGEAA